MSTYFYILLEHIVWQNLYNLHMINLAKCEFLCKFTFINTIYVIYVNLEEPTNYGIEKL